VNGSAGATGSGESAGGGLGGSGRVNGLNGRGGNSGLDELDEDGGLGGLTGGSGGAGPDGSGPAALGGSSGSAGLDGSNGSAGLDSSSGSAGLDGSSLNGLGRGHGLNGLSGDSGLNGGHGRSRLNGERLPADQRDTRNRTAGRHGRRAHGRAHDPEVVEVARTIRKPARDEDEHYVPPPPPPLPKLDPVAKGAWVALFGGPGYLVLATAAGWTITGLAAFLAVAAFVAGFAILVLRMHDPGPGGPNDGDDGAVV
jgi:hypothetical protein